MVNMPYGASASVEKTDLLGRVVPRGLEVYVLHAFQKKSKTGIKTPTKEIELVKARLRKAEEHYARWKKT